MSLPARHAVTRAWGRRKAKAGDPVQAGGCAYTIRLILWIDTTSNPKRARLWVEPVDGEPNGAEVVLCSCAGCSTGGGCRESTGEPCWHEHMAMSGSGPQGDDYARAEQRRKAKGWT